MLPAKFHNSRGILLSPFLRNGQNIALLWPKHGPNMVLQIGLSLILSDVPRDAWCQIWHCRVYTVAPFYGLFIAQLWSSQCPSNLFFWNLNQWAKECSIPKFTLLGVSCSHFFRRCHEYGPFMAQLWSSHGPPKWFFLNLD